MYNYITGHIVEAIGNLLIIETGGIGYEIHATVDCLTAAKIGRTQTIHIYLHVKEDSHTLYGFATPAERALFLQLINVSGVGAKSAVVMLSIGADALSAAISKGDVNAVSSIKGVSRKTMEKVILEMRGKLAPAINNEIDDAISGLVNLGLSRADAIDLIRSVDAKGTGKTAEQIVSLALKARSK